MNLHGYLAKNKIGYESEEAKDFANIFFMIMNYYSIERSMEIAKERGEKYQDFEQSDYANGKYFEFYTSQNLNQNLKRFANFLMVSIYLLQMIGKNCKIK